jgi:MFS transporter, DHA1 family, multidrug resistance protein
VMLSPMLAPVLGNAIADWAGWRAIFAVLAVAGTACGVAVRLFLGETLQVEGRSRATVAADWRRVMREPVFLRNLAIATSLGGSLYVFLAASPFLMVETYGVDPHHLGVPYGLVATGAGAGALSASALAHRLQPGRIMTLGTMFAAIGGAMLVAGVAFGLRDVAALVLPMMVVTFGGGLVTPNAIVVALAPLKGRVGTAVSLYGAMQMGGSAAATFAVALLPSHDPLVPAGAIAALALLAAALHLGALAGASRFRQ